MLCVFGTIYRKSSPVMSHSVLCLTGVHRLVTGFAQRLCQTMIFCRETFLFNLSFRSYYCELFQMKTEIASSLIA